MLPASGAARRRTLSFRLWARTRASKLFVRRHAMRSAWPALVHWKVRSGTVRSFGPIQRAEVTLSGSEGKTVIEIDAPRDLSCRPRNRLAAARRYRIFAAQN